MATFDILVHHANGVDVVVIDRATGIVGGVLPVSLGYPLWDWPRTDWYVDGEKTERPPYAHTY